MVKCDSQDIENEGQGSQYSLGRTKSKRLILKAVDRAGEGSSWPFVPAPSTLMLSSAFVEMSGEVHV